MKLVKGSLKYFYMVKCIWMNIAEGLHLMDAVNEFQQI